MLIVCDTQINDHMRDRVLCSQVVLLIQCMPLKIQINNQSIFHFLNIWSKEVPINISHPGNVSQIYGCLYESISYTPIRYIITRYKQIDLRK